jgi:hypothetical protein
MFSLQIKDTFNCPKRQIGENKWEYGQYLASKITKIPYGFKLFVSMHFSGYLHYLEFNGDIWVRQTEVVIDKNIAELFNNQYREYIKDNELLEVIKVGEFEF